jgi:uncharacterized protein YndB with AHSA1/START domain
MNVHRAFGWPAGAVLALLLLAGCASTSSAPPTPITSISQIEGKWRGTISFSRGPQEFYFLTVEPSGRLVAQFGLNWQWGQVTVQGGSATFELQGIHSGDVIYYEAPGPRTLILRERFASWSAQLTPYQ